MKMSDAEREAQLEIIKDACEKLEQHFDTVQIVATFDMKDSGTTIFTWGKGNWFARYGSVKAWISDEESRGTFINQDSGDEQTN